MWMRYKWFAVVCLLIIMAGVIATFVEQVSAVRGGDLGDLGIEKGEAKTKKVITGERPSKLKIAIGVGSLVVAILIVKFL